MPGVFDGGYEFPEAGQRGFRLHAEKKDPVIGIPVIEFLVFRFQQILVHMGLTSAKVIIIGKIILFIQRLFDPEAVEGQQDQVLSHTFRGNCPSGQDMIDADPVRKILFGPFMEGGVILQKAFDGSVFLDGRYLFTG